MLGMHIHRLLWMLPSVNSFKRNLYKFLKHIGFSAHRASRFKILLLGFRVCYGFGSVRVVRKHRKFRFRFLFGFFTFSWRRIVVRTLVSASELSLSCARLIAGWVTTLWLNRLLSVSQHGQLSHPSLRGR